MRSRPVRLLLILLALAPSWSRAADPEGFAAAARKLGEACQAANQPNIQGADPAWWFLGTDLLHAGTGEFWKDWSQSNVNQQDPVPFLVHFHGLLAAKGIHLVLIPVPSKAVIHPDKVVAGFGPGDPYPAAPFFADLASRGLTVIDLEPLFRSERAAGKKMHCETDAHFTPHACRMIAGAVASLSREKGWLPTTGDSGLTRGPETELTITGDQVPDNLRATVSETLPVTYCGRKDGDAIAPVEPDPASPVLLLGDSHTLVFQEGASRGMHGAGAGLLDQLQVEFGMPLHLVAVRGSGQKAARVELYRKASRTPGYWDGKKVVVWCFSAREFTQSPDKLIEVPIEKK